MTEELDALFQSPELSLFVPHEFRRSHGWLTWAVAYPVRNQWKFHLEIFRYEEERWLHSRDRRVSGSVKELDSDETNSLLKEYFDRAHPRVLPRPKGYRPPTKRNASQRPGCPSPRFSDAIVVAPLVATPVRAVERWEQKHKLTLPPCYREYVTKFGPSMFRTAVTVIPPEEIDREMEERNRHWVTDPEKRWFDPLVLDHQNLLETIPIATTSLGDYGEWIVFHPSDPATIYIVRDIGVKKIGNNFDEALRWVFREFPPIYPDRPDVLPRTDHNTMFAFSSVTSSEPQVIRVRDGQLSEPLKFKTSHHAQQIIAKAKNLGLPYVERQSDDMHELFFPSFGGVLSAWSNGARVDAFMEDPKGIERVVKALSALGLKRTSSHESHQTESTKNAESEQSNRYHRLREMYQRVERLGGVFHGDCPSVMGTLRTEARGLLDQLFRGKVHLDTETRRLVDDATNRCFSCDQSTKMMCDRADRIFFDLYVESRH